VGSVVREELILSIPGGHDPETTFYAAVDALAETLGVTVELLDEQVEKGIQPHPSHYQHRSAQGTFATPPDPHLLRRLSPQEAEAAAGHAQYFVYDVMTPRLLTHLSDGELGHLTPTELEKRCIAEVRHAYPEMYLAGRRAAGDPAPALTPQGKAQLKPVIDDELTYLHGFMEDVAAGKGKMPYHDRMRLYGNAAWEAFWLGWTFGDLRPGRDIAWRYGGTQEHCETCAHCVGLGWLPVADFIAQVARHGWMPRSGNLACKGIKCLCTLQERVLGTVVALWPYAEELPEALQVEVPPATPVAPAPPATPVPFPPAVAAPGGGAAATAEARLALALTVPIAALFLLAAGKRQRVLRDAVAYEYFLARARAAYANDPKKRKALDALSEAGPRWLAEKHGLTTRQAEEVLEHAASLRAFETQGRFVAWRLTRWPAPRLEDYADLERRYAAKGVA